MERAPRRVRGHAVGFGMSLVGLRGWRGTEVAAAALDRSPRTNRGKRRARFAEAARLPLIDIAERDIDVPLSPLGEQQSIALGQWFGALPRASHPNVVLCSPYVRARSTARLVLEAAGIGADSHILHSDERLREKEFGVLDRLTTFGIRERHPQLSEQRAHVGKFYFRPPETYRQRYPR